MRREAEAEAAAAATAAAAAAAANKRKLSTHRVTVRLCCCFFNAAIFSVLSTSPHFGWSTRNKISSSQIYFI